MTLRDQGFRYCLSPDRTHSRWLHPNELKATHSDWMDVTDTPTDELVALICWQDKPLPHGEAECLAVQESLPLWTHPSSAARTASGSANAPVSAAAHQHRTKDMTQSKLKAAGRIGAELGAAKAENEKLRGLLERIRTTCCQVRDAQDLDTAPGLSAAESLHEQIEKLDAALSQQAEPEEVDYSYHSHEFAKAHAEPTDTYTAVDMATAAAQGFRDGQAAVEPAPAQDERETFEQAFVIQEGVYWSEDHQSYRSMNGRAIEDRDAIDATMWWTGWKARAALARPAQTEQQPELTVWEGPMPESNGKSNFTAVLVRKGQSLIDGISDGMTIARSEYPDRVRYEADCVRYLIGERQQKPCITDYDADKHSGYAAPIAQTAPQGKFAMHQRVRKTSGSEWQGRICGTYSTALTPEGYAVESEAHAGSVQIYPAKALEAVE